MSELEQAKQSLSEEQLKVQESQRQVDKQRDLLSNPNALRKAGLGYLLSPAYKRQKIDAESQLNLAQENVSTRKQELRDFEKNIVEYEKQENYNQEQQRLYDEQVAEQQRQINDYNFGRKLALSGKGALGLNSKEARQGYIDAREGLDAVSKYKIQFKEQEALKKLNLPLLPQYTPAKFMTPVGNIPKSQEIPFLVKLRQGVGTVSREVFERVPLFTFSFPGTDIRAGGRPPQELVEFQTGFVEGFIPTTKSEVGLTALSFGIGAGIGASLRGGGAVLRGTIPRAAPFVERTIVIGGTALIIPPIIEQAKQIESIENSIDKGLVVGSGVRNLVVLGYGTKVGFGISGKVIGSARTIGLTEVPQESVIERGFFEGQPFPQIKKGTTPQQLRQEFFNPKLPGETSSSPKGFSARIQPLPSKTELGQVRAGELQGTYIAPGISPKFFRAGSENGGKLFSFEEFGKLPTAERITIKDIVYAPRVKPFSPRLVSQFTKVEAERISNLIKGTGRAVIAFIKTEKEAVLGAETPLRIVAKRFFVRDPISGERVPIFEREVVPTKEFEGFGNFGRGRVIRARESVSSPRSSSSIFSPGQLSTFDALISKYSKSSVAKRSPVSYLNYGSRSRTSTGSGISIPSFTGGSSIPDIPSDPSFISPPSTSSIPSFTSIPDIPSVPSTPRIPYIPRTPILPPNVFPKMSFKERKRRIRKQALAYSILIKRRGKYVPFKTGLPRGRALQLASSNVERELSRQFRIVQSGTTESEDVFFRPNERIFRDYKVVRGKRVPLAPGQFIQRTASLLKSPEEKMLISESRRQSKAFNF